MKKIVDALIDGEVAEIRVGVRKFELLASLSKDPVMVMLREIKNIPTSIQAEVKHLVGKELLVCGVSAGATSVDVNSTVLVVEEDEGGDMTAVKVEYLDKLNKQLFPIPNSGDRVVVAINPHVKIKPLKEAA